MRLLSVGVLSAALSLFASVAHAELQISVDKSTQRMTVTVDGEAKYVWPVSTGRSGHYTPVGAFTPFRLEIDHKSKEWDDAPMPHSIFFTKQGHAIHGSYNTKQLGQPASAGCVRLAPANAALLFSLVKQHGLNSTKVSIGGDESLVARRRGRDQVASAPQQPRAAYDSVDVWPNPFAAPRAAEPEAQRMERPRAERRVVRSRAEPNYYYEDRGYAERGAPQGYYGSARAYQQPQPAPRAYRYYPYYGQ